MKCAVVIPTLNESENLARVLEGIPDEKWVHVFVVDGGSEDNTVEIARLHSFERASLAVIYNEKKIQAAAINKVAFELGSEYCYLVRMDAHMQYPAGWVLSVVDSLKTHDAGSVVVPMYTVGGNEFQNASEILFNSRLGNGGAAHRSNSKSQYVKHGHHAGFKLNIFKKMGGYNEHFAANEDAEFDYRLAKAGYDIWLDATCRIEYYPRKNFRGLRQQFYRNGVYRAKNSRLHRRLPAYRQLLPVCVVLALLMFPVGAVLSFYSKYLLLLCFPFAVYVSAVSLVAVGLGGCRRLVICQALVAHVSFGCGFLKGFLRVKF
jgi:succinoglycan biosynthesis protein ExoA